MMGFQKTKVAKIHDWCCCVDQPGLMPDNIQFTLSIPVRQMEGTHLCLRWIGTQLVKFVVGCQCVQC